MPVEDNPILVETAAGVATIRFNRPDRFNALDKKMGDAFCDALNGLLDDEATRVIVLASAGPAFVAGGDLDYFRRSPDRTAAARALIDPFNDVLGKLAISPKIAIASVHGAAAGGGISLMAACDLAIAATDSTFNAGYIHAGASPDGGFTFNLPAIVGTRKAMEIALLGESFDAAEALRLGLVNKLVAPEQLDAETDRVARRLAKGPTVAIARTKALLRSAGNRTYEEQLAAEGAGFDDCTRSADFSEALDAFAMKRRPQFTGK